MQLQVATLLLCVRGATGLHARPALPLSPRMVSRLRSVAPVCVDADGDSDELAKAKELAKFRRIRDEQDGEDDELAKARRRRDEQALQSEWGDGLSKNAQACTPHRTPRRCRACCRACRARHTAHRRTAARRTKRHTPHAARRPEPRASRPHQERDDALRADELSMLRQRIDLIETKEVRSP